MEYITKSVDFLNQNKYLWPVVGLGALWSLKTVSSAIFTTKWPFTGKVVIITGASSGIGRACAVEAARRGASGVVIAARDEEALKEVAAECEAINNKCRAIVVRADVSIQNDCKTIVDEAVKAFDRIDCLILNAGIGMGDFFEDVVDVSLYERMMNINFMHCVWVSHYAIKHIIASRGRIVPVSSVFGKIGLPLRTGYAASKFAVEGFFQTLRTEMFRHGVKITIVSPGYIDTNIDKRRIGADGQVGSATHNLSPKGAMKPEKCAQIMLDATERGDREAFPAFWYHGIISSIQYFAPWLVDIIGERVALKMLSREKKTM